MTPDDVRDWGKHAHGSPLYVHLVDVIAADPELMRLLNRVHHLPPVNLLLGGVQHLLFGGADSELGAFYQSITPDPRPPEKVDRAFRDFVLAHEEELVDIGNTRFTQTNEGRRCVALLPLLMMSPHHEFHLVDIGSSAGINLAIDRYHYRWGALEWGGESPVTLEAESRGESFPLHEITVRGRIGLDLKPIPHDDIDGRRWLDALIWPEHTERRARLRAALEMVSGIEMTMVEGDALETLPAVLDGLPDDEPAVVMDAFSLNQFTSAGRRRVEEIAEKARSRRPVYRASMGVLDKADDWPRLRAGSDTQLAHVGQAHPHGEWIEIWRTGD